jgi:hypothetical protein
MSCQAFALRVQIRRQVAEVMVNSIMVRAWCGPVFIMDVSVRGGVGPRVKLKRESVAIPNLSVRIFWMVSQVSDPRKVSGCGMRMALFCVRGDVFVSAAQ